MAWSSSSSVDAKDIDRQVGSLRPLDRPKTAVVEADSSSCQLDAMAVERGGSIQAAVDFAGGAVICLKNGIHRAQAFGRGRSNASTEKATRF
jgi:hypothetical protein